jgi:anaerobic selenocysteine-containing dehydrogenase
MMNANDIEKYEFTIGQEVTVESSCAKMTVEVVEGRIREGNVAMYYPEGNAIVPCVLDPQSKTPVFKRVEVKIY